MIQMHNPAHPGAILKDTMGNITVAALARHLGITRPNLTRILKGTLGISAAVAIKLSEAYPESTPENWLALQNQYDLAKARKAKRTRIKPVLKTAA